MTPQQAFKLGFITRCLDEGLTVQQANDRAAFGLAMEKSGGILDGVKSLAGGLGGLGILGLLGGAGAGMAGGAAVASAVDQPMDPEEAKMQELISTYRQHAEEARRTAARRTYRRPIPRLPQLRVA